MNVVLRAPKVETEILSPERKPPPWKGWFFLLFIAGIVGLVAQWQEMDFLEPDTEGKPKLAQKRQKKLEKLLKEFDEAEQYALKAAQNGYYPCYNCGADKQIYLYARQVWYYGSTRKKEMGRYGTTLQERNLLYVVEYKGDIGECQRRELIQIFNYPTLPENVARAKPLIRPPGNKIDH
ncbi:MAG: hypothetical protein SH848_17880 [Saprospiraceae bacterium]|nr:hypothetical protein [Saprospiraceae bacterium]